MNISGLGNALGHGTCFNTSLNLRGELMDCSPTDALNMLCDSERQSQIRHQRLGPKI